MIRFTFLFLFAALCMQVNAQVDPVDGCSGVPLLTVNSSCVNNSYTLPANYSNSGLINASCVGASNDFEDGWFRFVANSTSATIELTGNRVKVLGVFTSCAGGTEVACDLQNNSTTATATFPTVSGSTYYVQIHRRGGGNNVSMSGNICVYSTPVSTVANDNPCSATALTVGSNCTYVNSTNAGATATTGPPAPGCASYSGGDVWFTAVVPASGVLTVNTNSGTVTDGGMAMYSGTCGSLTLIECDDDDSPNGLMPMITRTGLTPGSTVWIRVWEFGNDNNGSFSICAYSPAVPTNDECSGATSLTVNPDQLCGSVTSGSVNLSTASANANSCFGTDDDDVWFSFVATGTVHTIDLLNVSGSTTDLYHAVFAGSCAATGTAILCSDPNSSVVSGLTPGSTYYVRVYTWTSTTGQTTTFDICIGTPPPPPANDNCATAISLPVNATAVCTSFGTGQTASATSSQSGCVGTAHDDVWFSFTALATEHDIALSNMTGTTDMVHQVFSGTCGSLTSISCSDPESSSLTGLTVGATYFVRVYTYSSTGVNNGFQICVTSPCGITNTPPSCNLDYSHTTTPYAPESYTTGTLINFTDDRFADNYISIGFPFCYDGVTYNDVLVSSNGYVTFPGCYSTHPLNSRSTPGGYSEYLINAAAPNTTNAPLNAILGAWQDIYPSSSLTDGEIRTKVVGTAPNRKFVISYYNVRMFSCNTMDYSGQIILYETTNNIEIHMGEKTVCTSFNSGAAIMGLTNYTGTTAVIPAGYNYPTQWSVPTSSPQGHRFTSNCGVCADVLPVELISFTGKRVNGIHQLSWVTAMEINNDHFIVERSTDGKGFEVLGRVDGNGNTRETSHYKFNDETPENGVNYYRLRQTDYDGKVSYSEIISIRQETGDLKFDVYPNPFTDELNLSFVPEHGQVVLVKVVTMQGQVIRSEKHETAGESYAVKLQMQHLPSGMYYILLTDEQGRVLESKKVIKPE